MMNRFVKNGRIRKFWLTEITGPFPEVIPNILAGRIYRNFRNLFISIIRGFQVSMHCSMSSEVMVIFSFLFFNFAFDLSDFGTVAASEVNGSVVTAWITRFVNIVIGGTSDVERTQKIGCVVTLAWRRINKLLLSTSES